MRILKALLFSLALWIPSTSTVNAQNLPPLPTVASLDAQKYAGLWYQIADYPQSYELAGCSDCVTAKYTLNPDKSIGVFNSATGTKNCSITGSGKNLNPSKPGELKIRFSFIPNFVPDVNLPDYWIVELGPLNAQSLYSWSIVSKPDRKDLYLLSRTPSLPADEISALKTKLINYGFDLGKLKFTNQDVNKCHYSERM
jgi:apolipoprotein D and lipocalin family protein